MKLFSSRIYDCPFCERKRRLPWWLFGFGATEEEELLAMHVMTEHLPTPIEIFGHQCWCGQRFSFFDSDRIFLRHVKQHGGYEQHAMMSQLASDQ